MVLIFVVGTGMISGAYVSSGIESVEDGLGFENAEGTKTLLLFEVLPEIPDKASDAR